MTRTIVLGAGVLGASTAYHLALAGAEVTVLEATGPAAGTSGATFSADVTHLKTPRSYYALNRHGSKGHKALAAEFGGTSWLHPAPLVQWAHGVRDQEALRDKTLRAQNWGHRCRFAKPGELRTLAPAVDPAACRSEEVVVHDDTAWYDAPAFVRALLERAVLLGARVRHGVRVTGLRRDGDRVTGVIAGRQRWDAATVVNCAGPDAGRVAALAGVRLPLTRVPGLVAESVPGPGAALGAIVAAPGVDLRPAPGARILALSWAVDARLGDEPDGLAHELHRRAEEVLPVLRGTALERARIGVRPVPVDGLPLAGCAPGAAGLYHLVSHSAVTLAPVLGRLAAREITTGRPAPELAAYRPGRPDPADVHDENLRAMHDRRREAGE